MATTTNYSWTTPDDTALVKDGALAIRTLGSSVDTTVKNLNPETTTGAIAYRGATANVKVALPIGTAGQVLTVNSGATAPGWATPTGMPVGIIIFYAANTAPTGFLKANGAAVSRSTYANLFTEIGTTFGVGDGSTTFNVPDMRGYFARGWVDNGTIDSGRSFGSSQVASASAYNRLGASNFPISGGQDFDSTFTAQGGSASAGNFVDLQFGRVRPYNVAFLACIKF